MQRHLLYLPLPRALRHIGVWLAAAGLAMPGLAAPPGGDALGSKTAALNGTASVMQASLRARMATSTQSTARVAATDINDGFAWTKVDDNTLDAARGGFTNNGLTVSLGIDRIVAINGEVVAHTRIDIADLGRIGVDQARQTSEALSSVKLVQNGSANIYRAGEMGAALGGIVIQNSLDNQQIRADTVIHSTVNSAGLLNAMHFHGTLQDSLTRAVGRQ